jgi:predicted DNA-binding transcriptional regulator AlpA
MAKTESEDFLTCKEAAHFLRMNVYSFYQMMRRKGGPPVIKLSQSSARVPRAEFMRWLESKKLNGEKRA